MKTFPLFAILVLPLLLPTSGHAFYNPSTGRWLARDPLEETGGHALYAFVGNAPAHNIDALGDYWNKSEVNGSFMWREYEVPPPPVTDRRIGQHGHTDLDKWQVHLWTVPPGVSTKPTELTPGPCCWRLRGRGEAVAHFWSNEGPNDPSHGYEHELNHLSIFHAHWDGLTGVVSSFLDRCLSYKQLSCYRGVTPRLVNAYRAKAYLENVREDANDPTYPAAVRAEKQRLVDLTHVAIESEFNASLEAVRQCGN